MSSAGASPDAGVSLADASAGVLLGVFVGDALGAPFEGEGSASVARACAALGLAAPTEMADARRFPDAVASAAAAGLDLSRQPDQRGRYTDDTECTLALAESLVACGGLHARHAALNTALWWARPPDHGGYSVFTFEKLAALARGADPLTVGSMHNDKLPGVRGSNGNGAPMRVAPLGVAYRALATADPRALRAVVSAAVSPTHTHPEAIDASLVMVAATARLVSERGDAGAVENPAEFVRFLASVVQQAHAGTPSPPSLLLGHDDAGTDADGAAGQGEEEAVDDDSPHLLLERLRAVAAHLESSAGASAAEGGEKEEGDPKVTAFFSQADKEFLQATCTEGKWFQIRAIDAVTYVVFIFAKYGGLDVGRGSRAGLERAEAALVRMVALGGDTDTLAAMLGALLGARHGTAWVPERWWSQLETNSETGRERCRPLGQQLAAVAVPSGGMVPDNDASATPACDALTKELAKLDLPVRHEGLGA